MICIEMLPLSQFIFNQIAALILPTSYEAPIITIGQNDAVKMEVNPITE